MDLSKFIAFDRKPSGHDNDEQVDALVQKRLAEQIQMRLRNQVDPGISLAAARRAQAIRARVEDGSIVINEEDQGNILPSGEGEGSGPSEGEPAALNLDDLFMPSSGVPVASKRADGSTQLVFRSIRAEDIFNEQSLKRNNELVRDTIADVLRSGTVDAIEDAMREVDRLDRSGG